MVYGIIVGNNSLLYKLEKYMLVKLSSSLLGANSSLSEPVSFEQWLSLIAIWNKGHP